MTVVSHPTAPSSSSEPYWIIETTKEQFAGWVASLPVYAKIF